MDELENSRGSDGIWTKAVVRTSLLGGGDYSCSREDDAVSDPGGGTWSRAPVVCVCVLSCIVQGPSQSSIYSVSIPKFM